MRRTDWDGPAAQAFALAGQGSAGLMGQQVRGLAVGSLQVSDFIYETGVNVQYMKIIVLEELVLLAAQIAHLIAMAVPTSGASMAAVPGLKALGQVFARLAQSRLCAWLLSVAAGEVLQLALDSMAQAAQLAAKTRTHWDEKLTENAAITGAVGAVVGPVAHAAVAGLVGRGVVGQVVGSAVHEFGTSAVTGAVTGQGFVGSPWDVTAGATEGAVDAAGQALARRRRAGFIPPVLDVQVAVPPAVSIERSVPASVTGDASGGSPAGGAGNQQPVSRVSTDPAQTVPVSEMSQRSPQATAPAVQRQQDGQQGQPAERSQQGSPETVPAAATPQPARPHAAPVEAGPQVVLPQAVVGVSAQAQRATAAPARQWRQQPEQQAAPESLASDARSEDQPREVLRLRRVGLPGGAPGEQRWALDEEALVRRLTARGLVLQDVLPDEDSFWNSLLITGGDRIRARLGLAQGEPVTAMAVRRFVADQVGVDEVASSSVGDPDADPAALIMAPGARAHQEFAPVAEAAALVLGLPVTVITPEKEYQIGGGDGPRLHLARVGDAYRPVVSAADGVPSGVVPSGVVPSGVVPSGVVKDQQAGVEASIRARLAGRAVSRPDSDDSYSDSTSGSSSPRSSVSSVSSVSSDTDMAELGGWSAETARLVDEYLTGYRRIRRVLGVLYLLEADLRQELAGLARLGELTGSVEDVLGDVEVMMGLGRLAMELRRRPQGSTQGLRSAVNLALLCVAVEPVAGRVGASGGSVRYERSAPGLTIGSLVRLLAAVADDVQAGRDPMEQGSVSGLAEIGYARRQPLAQRLARLSLLNLSADMRRVLRVDGLFDRLVHSDLLVEAMRASGGVDQAVFLQTGRVVAVNQLVRAQVPTIAGLLVVGRHLAEVIQQRLVALQGTPVLKRVDRRGFPRSRRTYQQLAEQYLARAERRFAEIESRVEAVLARYELTDDRGAAERELRALTVRWSEAIQQLSVLTHLRRDMGMPLPVLTRMVVPGSPGRSRRLHTAGVATAAVLSVATVPEFSRMDRRSTNIDSSYDEAFDGMFASSFQRWHHEALASATADSSRFWSLLRRQPGHTVVVGSGWKSARWHSVRAIFAPGGPLFLVEDPRRGTATTVQPSQVYAHLTALGMDTVSLPDQDLFMDTMSLPNRDIFSAYDDRAVPVGLLTGDDVSPTWLWELVHRHSFASINLAQRDNPRWFGLRAEMRDGQPVFLLEEHLGRSGILTCRMVSMDHIHAELSHFSFATVRRDLVVDQISQLLGMAASRMNPEGPVLSADAGIDEGAMRGLAPDEFDEIHPLRTIFRELRRGGRVIPEQFGPDMREYLANSGLAAAWPEPSPTEPPSDSSDSDVSDSDGNDSDGNGADLRGRFGNLRVDLCD